jgi:hypothetical protein
MPPLATLKLIGYGVGALAVIALLAMVNGWRVQAHDRGEKLAVICQATRDASALPKLNCGEVPAQIKFMGQAVTSLSNALATQNAAVKALGAETARQQQASAQASQAAQERSQGAQVTSTRLEASSRSGERQAKPCEPSKALEEAWR